MKMSLGSLDMWEVVEDYMELSTMIGWTQNQLKALKNSHKKNKITFYTLYREVDETNFEKIANLINSKEAWKILKKAYKGAH